MECTCREAVTGNIVETTVRESTLRRCASTPATMKTFVVSFSNSETSLLQSFTTPACGVPNTMNNLKIVGGVETQIGEYPWQVRHLLHFTLSDNVSKRLLFYSETPSKLKAVVEPWSPTATWSQPPTARTDRSPLDSRLSSGIRRWPCRMSPPLSSSTSKQSSNTPTMTRPTSRTTYQFLNLKQQLTCTPTPTSSQSACPPRGPPFPTARQPSPVGELSLQEVLPQPPFTRLM